LLMIHFSLLCKNNREGDIDQSPIKFETKYRATRGFS
jgi:hypothetical protein